MEKAFASRNQQGERPSATQSRRGAGLIIAGAVALLALGIGMATQPGRPAAQLGGLTPQPAPSLAPAAIRTVHPPDTSISFAIPAGWMLTDGRPLQYWQYTGTDPVGRMTISFGTPLDLRFCRRRCRDLAFDVAAYNPTAALEVLSREISELTGIQVWHPLADEQGAFEAAIAHEELVGDFGQSREMIVVAAFPARAVVVSWVQPAGAFDRELLSRLISNLAVDPAGPQYSGRPYENVVNREARFALIVPDVWYAWTLPMLGPEPAPGVWRYGRHELTISVGEADGRLRLCDMSCSEFRDQASLDALGSTISSWLPPVANGTAQRQGDAALKGEPAKFIAREVAADAGSTTRYVAYSLHDGRPFALSFDVPTETFSQAAIDAIVGSFQFFPPRPALREVTIAAPDGTFGLRLPDSEWRVISGPDPNALYLVRKEGTAGAPSESYGCCGPVYATVRMADADGRVRTCDRKWAGASAPGWTPPSQIEQCIRTAVRSLEELMDATGFQLWRFPELFVDGEPAALVDWRGYQYPASGGQYLKYVFAMHNGRPVSIRFWTGNESGLEGVDEVVNGFRFLD